MVSQILYHDTTRNSFFFFSSRRRHTRLVSDWSSDVCSSDLVIKDAIADNALQQVLLRPEDFDVIATLNLNGDYLSDALAAQVGGIGIAPGGNINYITGHAVFEAKIGRASCRERVYI